MMNLKSGSAFTLLEIVLAIAVFSILAGALAPYAVKTLQQARWDATDEEMGAIQEGLVAYYRDCGRLPADSSGLGALVNNVESHGNWDGPYVGGNGDIENAVLTDSWGNSYSYASNPRVTGLSTNADFFVISPGEDRTLSSSYGGGIWTLDSDADLVRFGSTVEADDEMQVRTEALLDEIADGLGEYYLDMESFPPGIDSAALGELLGSSSANWDGPYIGGPIKRIIRDLWGQNIALRSCTSVNGQAVSGRILVSDGTGSPGSSWTGEAWTTSSNDLYRVVSGASMDILVDREKVNLAKQQVRIAAGAVYTASPQSAPSPDSLTLTSADPWGNTYQYSRISIYSAFVYSCGADGGDDGGNNDDIWEALVWSPSGSDDEEDNGNSNNNGNSNGNGNSDGNNSGGNGNGNSGNNR